MSRLFAPPLHRLLLLSFLVSLAFAAHVQADTTYTLTAMPNINLNPRFEAYVTSFTLTWVGPDGETALQPSDIPQVQLSGPLDGALGMSPPPWLNPFPTLPYAVLWSVPAKSSASPFTDEVGDMWHFASDRSAEIIYPWYDQLVPAEAWTYTWSASPNAPEVPLPPSVLLLGTGLIPLAWARRKKD